MTNFTNSLQRKRSWKRKTMIIGGLIGGAGLLIIWTCLGWQVAVGALLLLWGDNLQQAAARGEFGP